MYDDTEPDDLMSGGTVSFPDDVPVADAVEQQQVAADLAPEAGLGELTPPLESDPGDWHEQHQSLGDLDVDDERR